MLMVTGSHGVITFRVSAHELKELWLRFAPGCP